MQCRITEQFCDQSREQWATLYYDCSGVAFWVPWTQNLDCVLWYVFCYSWAFFCVICLLDNGLWYKFCVSWIVFSDMCSVSFCSVSWTMFYVLCLLDSLGVAGPIKALLHLHHCQDHSHYIPLRLTLPTARVIVIHLWESQIHYLYRSSPWLNEVWTHMSRCMVI